MNKTLTALNAAALTALLVMNFQASEQLSTAATHESSARITTQTAPRQVPQLAIMTDSRANPAMLTNDTQDMPQATGSTEQRWVF